MKQKIKELDEKVDKYSTKITDITKECEESTNLISQLEEDIPKLQKLFLDEENVLRKLRRTPKLAKVIAELEPWEKQLIDHNGKLEVTSTERKLLNEKLELISKVQNPYIVEYKASFHQPVLIYTLIQHLDSTYELELVVKPSKLGKTSLFVVKAMVLCSGSCPALCSLNLFLKTGKLVCIAGLKNLGCHGALDYYYKEEVVGYEAIAWSLLKAWVLI
ncbi:unnamed protein product [Ilex paraguariensis]|uniref:Uncharacterized protein n=1 Tax=Ilex paraguariensis TaxID=185542 RepID=A0ABC8SYD6_9AQUA